MMSMCDLSAACEALFDGSGIDFVATDSNEDSYQFTAIHRRTGAYKSFVLSRDVLRHAWWGPTEKLLDMIEGPVDKWLRSLEPHVDAPMSEGERVATIWEALT